MMSDPIDISDYNYFDVEDFSVDSFFRSLELQSRFASNDLEFSFPTDLESVPISSCLTSVAFLDGSSGKCTNASSGLSVVEDIRESRSGSTEDVPETCAADESNDDEDNAIAVDSFFRSLQLRSCLLRANDETIQDSPHASSNKTDRIDHLFSHSWQVAGNVERKIDEKQSRCERDSGSVYLARKSLTDFDCLSSAWTRSSDGGGSYHVTHSETAAADSCFSSADYRDLCKTAPRDSSNEEQPRTATTSCKTDASSEIHATKGVKMSCAVCSVELSSKYSYVRHLLTPLHRRRAEGYCVSNPPSGITNCNTTEDIIKLISRQKPIQCRICHFYGDTFSQLLCHVTSTSHYSRVKRKLLCCLPCQFVGKCDDIVAHLKSESHITVVRQSNQPCVITDKRRYRRQVQAASAQTEDKKACSHCGAKFPSASSLAIHIRRKHTGERPFTCRICCKSYCDNSTLRLHLTTVQHRAKCAELVQFDPS